MELISLSPKHSNNDSRPGFAEVGSGSRASNTRLSHEARASRPATASPGLVRACFALLLLFCGDVLAQSPTQTVLAQFQYLKVGEVRIQADGPVDTAHLLNLIELTPNVDIVTTSKIRKSIELLYATGNFANILVDAQKQQDRVQLTFILRLIYRFRSIKVTGGGGPPYGKLRKVLGLRKFEPYLPEKVLRGREQLLKQLIENGYFQAKVIPDVLLFRDSKRAELIYAIQPGPPSYVGTLQFSGNPHFPDEEIRSRMKSTPGRRFQPQEFKRDMERIEALYDKNGFLEHQINVKRNEQDSTNHTNLEIEIVAGRPIAIEIEGYKLSEAEVDENIPVRAEHSYNDDTLEEGKRNLILFFQRKGFYDAEVWYNKIITNENIVVRYDVKPGTKYEIENILITGNEHLEREKILDLISTRESGIFSKHLVQRDFESDQSKILAAYKENGFLFARFIKTGVVRHAEGKIDIDIVIDEGPQVMLAEYRFQGNEVISAEELIRQISQKVGEPISESKVKNDSRYIVSIYSERGYPKMQLENKLRLSQDKTRSRIEYQITEGDQIFVDRIVISGNYRTRRSIVEKTLLFAEDDPLSLRKIAASQSKLYGLEIFDRVDIDIPRPDSLRQHQPVTIQLTETRPYTIRYGIGFESYNKLNGVFSISNRNWLGIDRTIGLQLRSGFNERRALLTLNDPHLFGERNPSTFSGIFEEASPRNTFSYTRLAFTFENEKKLSQDPASLQVGQKAPPLSSLFFGYGFEDINTTGTPELTPQERRFLDIHISYLNASFVRDSRDNQIDPYRGTFFSTNLEWATSLLGSETDFLKSFNQFQHFIPVQKRSVIATSVRIGLARGYRETIELPLQRRFFAGGGRTIRGFDLDTAGPLDENGDPLGGNAVFIINLEYRFPVFASFGAVIFFDYGSAFELIEDVSLDGMRETAGIGLRYNTPIGPLTLDWGYKLDRRLEPIRESPSEFFLSVGHAF